MADRNLIEEFKTAYKVQHLRPIRGFFYVQGKRYDFACPLVALAIHRGVADGADPDIGRDNASNAAIEWAAATFGQEWVLGFLDGFDRQTERTDNPEYLQGYGLGAALALDILSGVSPYGP